LNSFGYGGTNAHVILEPAPAVHLNGSAANGVQNSFEVKETSNGVEDGAHQPNGNGTHASLDEGPQANPQLFVLSATSEKSLVEAAKNVQSWISTKAPEQDCLSDLAYTLNVRRSLLPLRLSVVASTPDELVSTLESKNLRITKLPHSVSVAFIFTGQGAQWYAMGRELLGISSAFKDSILQSDKLIQSFGSEWSLVEELSKDEQSSRVSDSELSQPLTTAIQVALVDLLAILGVTPQYVCGHSSGEIGAAYAAGALTLEAAIEM
jgi:acyl transferase domain-containing protein